MSDIHFVLYIGLAALVVAPIIIALLIVRFSGVRTRRRPRLVEPIAPARRETDEEEPRAAAVPRALEVERLPEAKVVYVQDGDTLCVTSGWGWGQTKIRLDGIDCPEDGQPWGDTAKYGLLKIAGGRKVRLEKHGLDIHGRTLATVYVWDAKVAGWQNVNERMVMLGQAWVLRAYYDHLPKDRQAKLDRLEAWAKSKKVGLWRTDNPIPPWQWRKATVGTRN